MSYTTTLYILFAIILLVTIISTLFNFLGVNFAAYGNYLIWLIALVIFFYILPKRKNSVFI